MIGAFATIGEEAYERINCYGIGSWLADAYRRLGQTLPPTPTPWDKHDSPRSFGLILTIYSRPNIEPRPASADDALVLALIEGDATAPMPRRLDAANETPQSAAAKLSAAIEGGSPERVAAGDTRISYFVPDGKVVELRFNHDLVGFDRIVIAALGTASAYRG